MVPSIQCMVPAAGRWLATPLRPIPSPIPSPTPGQAQETGSVNLASIDGIDGLMARTRECISDLKVWITQNKLQLNDEKTELLLACPKKCLDHSSVPTFLEIGNTTVPFSSSVRSLGVALDPTLSFQQHISNVSEA